MEHKFVRISIIFFYFSIVVITGCGYFDNDEIIFEKKIVGNFKVSRQENSSSFTLIFLENPHVSAGLIENCKRILYDSTNKYIYVESVFDKYNYSYYQVHILNAESSSTIGAFKQSEINVTTFNSLSTKLPLVFDINSLPPSYP
jgi:hypothetical protein